MADLSLIHSYIEYKKLVEEYLQNSNGENV